MSAEFVTIRHKNQVAKIAKQGGGLAQYFLENGENFHLVYGYDHFDIKEGGMGDILGPWPGRLEKQKYVWKGKEYSVAGSVQSVDANGNALHGFLRLIPWNVEKIADNKAVARVELNESEYGPKGYPFSLSFVVEYVLEDNGLTVTTNVTNIGKDSAPFGIGFHPYFTVGGHNKVDDFELHIPSKTLIEYDKTLKPTGRLIDVTKEEQQYNFHEFKKINDVVFDNCYTKLEPDSNGRATTSIRLNGKTVSVWQDVSAYPYTQVYSFDPSKKGHARRGFAIEAESCCGFAFNVPNLGQRELVPGETFKGSWGVTCDFL
jgi:aldose 1-epimerase